MLLHTFNNSIWNDHFRVCLLSLQCRILRSVSSVVGRKIIIIIPHRNHEEAKYGSYYINNEAACN